MMDPSHIEEIEEQAALYSIGALPPAEAKSFRQRLAAGCPLCQAEVDSCETAVAGLSLSAGEIAPPPGLRARLLASISASGKKADAASQLTMVRAHESPWKPAPFPGVEMRYLLERKTMLVRMAPKSSIPAHPHASGEQCLVLEGSVTNNGVTAYAGDFTYMPAGTSHDELYSETGALFLITYA
jgi:mannose-6-phosphate isomerase-like protein (cupin superfamily)